ncbi:MAG: tRNA (uridine(34)/cytosine(34)/5-carboxymethylaminomethyluridine(34)-2'-O)-methyltransferase TrmL [Verrucomicrobia bacterium]|nr:tRNA (uridine(34)/cytosine(34)/5-carboxymethylaminomethyluridine(34)-2'-O)-methyltransferase TrmL [Verrucomicrobiota bacterium]
MVNFLVHHLPFPSHNLSMHVVLVEPEIPPNTGNVARLCAATGARLHLIEPLGFRLEDKDLKRAGMDYWKHVEWTKWPNWQVFLEHVDQAGNIWFVESDGPRSYSEVTYGPDDYLVFGRETAGLPMVLVREHPEQWLRIPMMNQDARSLNLSNCVSIVLYEALRQNGFAGEVR